MSLLDVYERTLHWLRAPLGRSRRRHAPDQSVVPVRVNLVGDEPPTSSPAPDPGSETPAAAPPPAPTHPFLATSAPAASDPGQLANPTEWQFNQPVLLRQSRRATGVMAWTAIGSVGAIALWAVVAPLGETVAVQGKLQPGSRVRQVQAPVPGVIEAVLVKDGETVRRGDELVRFDLREARSQLASAEAIRERLLNENQILAASLGDRAATGLTENQRLQLGNQAEDLRSRRIMAEEQVRASEARIAGLRTSYATAANIAERYEGLARSGAMSEVQALDARNRANELATSLAAEERTSAGLRASLINVQAAPGADLRGRIEANLRQIADLDNQISQSRLQLQYGVLTAPSDGSIFDIDVSPGSVVESARVLLRVVPGDALEARVFIPNNAIGYMSPGQKADISLDTFPSSDYGSIPARIERIGTDALTTEEMAETLRTDAKGLYYPATLRLESQSLPRAGGAIPLKPGMALTADINLRERNFLSLFTGFLSERRQELRRIR